MVKQELDNLLNNAKHDNVIGYKVIKPTQLSDGKWCCYCGALGWQEHDTLQQCEQMWYTYVAYLSDQV